MSVLNLERANPGLLVALCRHLDGAEGAVDRSVLEGRFMPGSVDRGPGKGPALTFDDTLAFGERVGVLSAKAGDIELRAPYRGRWSREDREAPWRTLTDCLLSEPVAGKEPFASDDGPAADLVRLAVWFAQVDPTGPLVLFKASGSGHHPKRLIEQMDGNADWIPGDQASWDPFVRWAVALGFARERPTTQAADRSLGVTPDVYRVTRDRLVTAHARTGRVETLEGLLNFLGQAVPLFSTGRLERAWREYVGEPEERVVSPPLSFALARLEHEGLLQLIQAGDGVPYAFTFGRYENVPSPFGPRSAEVRRYSNVRVLKEAA